MPSLTVSRTLRQNLLVYAALLLFCGITALYGTQLTAVRLLTWGEVALLLLGLPLLPLQERAGLPAWLNRSFRTGSWQPLLIGVIFGSLDVAIIGFLSRSEPYDRLPPFLQPFPYSIFLYGSGAFFVEVFYRLIPLTLLMWAGSLVAGGRYAHWFFWIGAVLTALREPLEQSANGPAGLLPYTFLSSFAMNLTQAWYFRRAGFLASYTLRLGHYLCWHILFGVWVEYVLLGGR
jgi:hypothetical protein